MCSLAGLRPESTQTRPVRCPLMTEAAMVPTWNWTTNYSLDSRHITLSVQMSPFVWYMVVC